MSTSIRMTGTWADPTLTAEFKFLRAEAFTQFVSYVKGETPYVCFEIGKDVEVSCPWGGILSSAKTLEFGKKEALE